MVSWFSSNGMICIFANWHKSEYGRVYAARLGWVQAASGLANCCLMCAAELLYLICSNEVICLFPSFCILIPNGGVMVV